MSGQTAGNRADWPGSVLQALRLIAYSFSKVFQNADSEIILNLSSQLFVEK